MLKTLSVAAVGLAFSFGAGPVRAADAICYNCPPEWADWASVLKALKEDVKLDVPHDNKNSGQTLSQLIAEKAQPVADVTYFGVTFGIQAKEEGVTEAYKPQGLRRDPGGPEGSGRPLVHDPFRNTRPLHQQGRARRQAACRNAGRTC